MLQWRRVSILAIVVLLTAALAQAGTEPTQISLGLDPSVAQVGVQLTAKSNQGMHLRFQAPSLNIIAQEAEGQEYQLLNLPGAELDGPLGQPALPLFTRMVAIPDGFTLEVGDVSSRKVDLEGTFKPWPAQDIRDRGDAAIHVDQNYYLGRAVAAAPAAVSVGEPGLIRGLRVVPVHFRPVNWNPADGRATVAAEMDVELRLVPSNDGNDSRLAGPSIPESFATMYEQDVIGFDRDAVNVHDGPGTYLIIHPDNASVASALEPLTVWRARQGYNVLVASTAETGTSTPRYGINPEGTGLFVRIKDAFATSGGLDDYAVVVLEDSTYPGADSNFLTLDGVSLVSRSGNPEACVIDFLGTPNTMILRSFNDDVPVMVQGITLANTSQTSYGFMDISGGLSVIVVDCIFRNHYFADTDTPPFQIWSTDYVEIRNCQFQDIIVDSTQPLFKINGLASDLVYISGCEFSGTQASGLLIQAEDLRLQMYGTTFQDNTAAGILHTLNNHVGWDEVTFAANNSVGEPMIMLERADLEYSGGSVAGNTSDDHIVEAYLSTGRMEGITFQGNYTDKIHGAGALNLDMSEMDIMDCLFEGNISDRGTGAIIAKFNDASISVDAQINIHGCTFKGNDSYSSSGALFVQANAVETTYSGNYQHVTLNLQTSTFDGNLMSAYFHSQIALRAAQENGPILPTGWIEFHMDQCLITNGETGNAISADLNPSSSTDIHCTNIHGNEAGDWDEPWLQTHFASLGNISEDPQYCDAAAGDLTLQSASPCLPLNNLCNVQIGAFGQGCSGASAVGDMPVAGRTGITGNFPNPFNPRTVLSFDLAEGGPVSLLVYDMSGHLVRTLIRDEILNAGPQEVVWNGCDEQGRPAAAGIYLVRLSADGELSSHKMIMIK